MKLISPTTIADTGTFSRPSVATYFDATGMLKTAAADELRIDHVRANGEWVSTGLRIEGASTNLLRYSDQLDNAAWSKTRSSVTADVALAPDGTTGADKVIESASAGTHVIYQAVTKAPVAERYAWSVFAKAGERSKIELLLDTDVAGNFSKCVFDLADGTVGSPVTGGAFSSPVVAIKDMGGGWYRCHLSAICDTDVSLYGEALLYSTAESYAGDGSSGLYVWGLQLELGSGSSYIPTGAASVTRAADTVTGSGLVYCSVPETDYPVWSAATAYAIGTRVMILATHKVYEALTANTNKAPASSPVDWIEVGATNRWRAFDKKVGTVSSATTSLTFVLRPGIVTGVALIGVSALSVTVSMADPLDGIVFNQTYDMQDASEVLDWHAYFFSEIRGKNTLIVEGLPSYLNGVLTITLTAGAGVAVSVGSLVVGWLYTYAPAVEYGASVGIQDYSRKEADTWGNLQVVERAFSRRAQFNFFVAATAVDALVDRLAALRATPAVYVGSGLYGTTVVYGFYKDFDTVISYPTKSECSIQIEGLV